MVEEYLTLEEAAERIGVHPTTVGRKVARGDLVGFLGPDRRKRYVRKVDVDRIGAITPMTRSQEPAEMPRPAA